VLHISGIRPTWCNCPRLQKVLTANFGVGSRRLFSQLQSTSSYPQPSKEENSPLFAQTSEEKLRREALDSIIRVNQAGEYGAKQIYAGQLAVLGKSDVGPIIKEMQQQELKHLDTFNEYMRKYRARPTAMHPLWNIGAYALGYVTASMGKEAAMACTVAVESAIGNHYNSQLRELGDMGINDPELRQCIKVFRDEELEHLDTGVKYNAQQVSSCVRL